MGVFRDAMAQALLGHRSLQTTERYTHLAQLHVVPRRFVRVRHYGPLANGVKKRRRALVRNQLDAPAPSRTVCCQEETWQETYRRLVGKDPRQCPACHSGRLVVIAVIPRTSVPARSRSPSRSP